MSTRIEPEARAATPAVDCHGASHVGLVRANNEDHFANVALERSARVLQTNLDDGAIRTRLTRASAHVFIVADGVGGSQGGEDASRIAVSTAIEYLAEASGCYQGMDVGREQEFMERLTAGVERAHQRLQERYGTGGRGPATTFTMVTLVWPRAYIVHVGDSRGYVLRRGRVRQFTSDQTMGDLFVDIGRVTEEQATKMGLYNVLASAVGTDIAPVVGVLDLDLDDALLLCTDGLTKHVADDRIAELLTAAPDAESACGALVDAALAEGGTDNVTVVVARFGPPV